MAMDAVRVSPEVTCQQKKLPRRSETVSKVSLLSPIIALISSSSTKALSCRIAVAAWTPS